MVGHANIDTMTQYVTSAIKNVQTPPHKPRSQTHQRWSFSRNIGAEHHVPYFLDEKAAPLDGTWLRVDNYAYIYLSATFQRPTARWLNHVSHASRAWCTINDCAMCVRSRYRGQRPGKMARYPPLVRAPKGGCLDCSVAILRIWMGLDEIGHKHRW